MKLFRGKMLYRQAEILHVPFTWSDGDTTPPINGGHFFKTGTTACTVTEFTQTPGSAVVKYFTVIIMVDSMVFQHSGGTFANCTTIWCPGAVNRRFKAGDIIDFVWDGTRVIMDDTTLTI